MLDLTFEGQKWIDRGVLIFSQFYDSAYSLAEYLLRHFDESIGLYANTSASKLFENGKVQSVDRELLKEKVTQGRLKLLIGTDAASTGLNLQRLGFLINLDLPWNPTILEQRKGRVQRGALAKRIPSTTCVTTRAWSRGSSIPCPLAPRSRPPQRGSPVASSRHSGKSG